MQSWPWSQIRSAGARASNGIASINRNDRSVQMNDRRSRLPNTELHLRVSLPFHHVPEAELLPERHDIYGHGRLNGLLYGHRISFHPGLGFECA